MSSNADCFIVLPANCASGSLILGRNAEDATEVGGVGVATEVCYYDVSDILEGKVREGQSKTKTSSRLIKRMTHLISHTNLPHLQHVVRLMAVQLWSQLAMPCV